MANVRIAWWQAASAFAALLTGALLSGFAPAAFADDFVEADPAGVREYWTPERMDEAQPVPVPGPAAMPLEPTAADAAGAGAARADFKRTEVADPAAEGVRMHGKVFFSVTDGELPGNYVCSGTAINSNNRSVVWTAGHCVYDADYGGGYASNWLFVPAYSEGGGTPYGEWPAEEMSAPSEWRNEAASSYDYSAVRVDENGSGEKLTEVVGGRPIAFSQGRDRQYTSYGYPAQAPPVEFLTGDREFKCESGLGGTDNPPGPGPNTNWIGCDMTGGSSGGGWIAGGSLVSVNSYSYCDPTGTLCQRRLYGPYMDDTAKRLYQEISGEAEFCQDKKVTVLGTGGADKLAGTGGKDVIDAGGGKDKVDGKGGKDTICGGGGDDNLRGGGGKDRLAGDGGDDKLKGGDGGDTCNGGKGKDKGKSCESTKKIP